MCIYARVFVSQEKNYVLSHNKDPILTKKNSYVFYPRHSWDIEKAPIVMRRFMSISRLFQLQMAEFFQKIISRQSLIKTWSPFCHLLALLPSSDKRSPLDTRVLQWLQILYPRKWSPAEKQWFPFPEACAKSCCLWLCHMLEPNQVTKGKQCPAVLGPWSVKPHPHHWNSGSRVTKVHDWLPRSLWQRGISISRSGLS